jgi:heptaprenyl diphosphate synthase
MGLIESLVPRPLPFMKPGLANIVTVIALVRFGFPAAVRINVLRCLAVALATGSLATPAFPLSLAGAASSVVAMGLAVRLVPLVLSTVGLSIVGGCASMSAQLAVAALVIPGLPAWSLALPAVIWGAASGALTGIAATAALRAGIFRGTARLVGEIEAG